MKQIFFLLVFLSFVRYSAGQVNMGIKLNPGIGYIRSASLDGIAASVKEGNPKIQTAAATTGPGINLGIGGFYQYNITPKISVLFEPTVNYLRSKIYLNFKEEILDNTGSGSQWRIASTADLKLLYFNVPFVARYSVWERKKMYAVGGFSINVNTKPSLKSTESAYYTDYKFENVRETTIIEHSNKYKLDNFNIIQAHLIIGVGKSFRRKLKNLSIDLRYHLPVTGSSMYSSSEDIKQNSANNSVFSSEENWQMGNSEKKLNRPKDFKMGMFNLSLKYTLHKKATK